MKENIAKNLTQLHGRIAEACDEYDRDADDITILAVSKTHPAASIRVVVAAGIHNIGESRIQEAEPKLSEAGSIARYHMIGHLQTNKVKTAVELFDVIQSVDSLHLAEEISRRAVEIERTIECLVQVNCSGEQQKFGVAPDECLDLLKPVSDLPGLCLAGLMTVGPFTDDNEAIRTAYRNCYELYRRGREMIGDDFDTLSMGMSDDFPLAIAEGATLIRVGTGIFGPRSHPDD